MALSLLRAWVQFSVRELRSCKPCGVAKGKKKRQGNVSTYNGILFIHKKKEFLPFATTGMDPEGIMLSEINQTEKDKYYMTSLICEI